MSNGAPMTYDPVQIEDAKVRFADASDRSTALNSELSSIIQILCSTGFVSGAGKAAEATFQEWLAIATNVQQFLDEISATFGLTAMTVTTTDDELAARWRRSH